ncbi:MAG: hypothetical protein ABR508_12870, partial [Candidatus Baltobacteraceae bacterium]
GAAAEGDRAPAVAVVSLEERDLDVGIDAVGRQQPPLGVDERERLASLRRLARRLLRLAEGDDLRWQTRFRSANREHAIDFFPPGKT